MPIINERNLREYMTREGVKPGTEIARFVVNLVQQPSWPSYTPTQKTAELTYDAFSKRVNLTLESYQAAMAILISNEVFDEEMFAPDTIYAFKKARLDWCQDAAGILAG